MNKAHFINEVEKQLRLIFGAIRDGNKPPEILRHRCEGFMRAGVFLGVVNNGELSELMEKIHFNVIGLTISERRASDSKRYKDLEIEYTQYDSPAYERRKK